MLVYNMRVRTNELITAPLLNFAGSVGVRFLYSHKVYFDGPLHDFLLQSVRSLDELVADGLPLQMREHVAFECRVDFESATALDDFKRYLGGRAAIFWVYLEGLLRTPLT